MQLNKIAGGPLSGGTSIIGESDSYTPAAGTPFDTRSLGMALPAATVLLASLAGFKAANKMSDAEAAADREARIAENLNRLGKTNLAVMQMVRKNAGLDKEAFKIPPGLLGTMFNPFQGVGGFGGKSVTPAWFKPSMAKGSPAQVDRLMFKTLALASTYGSLTFGLKYLLSAMERKKEETEGNKKIESSVRAAMPIISPDPSLRDAKTEAKQRRRGMTRNIFEKEASLEKEALGETLWDWVKKKKKEWDTGFSDPHDSSLTSTITAAALLAATTSFAGGAYFGKAWADERDPARQRIKAAEKAAKRMALQERPPAIIGAINPDVRDELDAHITAGRLKAPAAGQQLLEQEVDPTDTLSQNIATV